MKVLIFSDYFSTWNIGGASRVLSEQIRGLKSYSKEKIDLELISGYPGFPNREKASFKWFYIKYKAWNYIPGLCYFAWKRCRVFKPDVLHIHQPLIAIVVHLILPRHLERIYHFHSFWFEEKISHSKGSPIEGMTCWLKMKLEKWILKKMDRYIVLSEYSAQKLSEHVPTEKIVKIPGSINLKDWLPKADFIDKPNIKFLCVRRLDPRMGIDILLKGFANLVKEHPNCELNIIGTGRYEAFLKELAESLGIKEQCCFLGRVPDEELLKAMHNHDCMVIPTLQLEGFGMVVLEALATGLPVLATRVGGLSEFEKYEEVFHTIEQPTVEDLTEGLKWTIQHYYGAKDIAKKCRRVVEDNFATEKVIDSLIRVYRNECV